MNKLYKLEALRGLAAMYVVFHHTIPHTILLWGLNFGYLVRFGQEAVILFFLLSGFVINYSYQNSKNKSFRSYFAKRFVRIYVPLLIIFLLTYLSTSYNAGQWVDPQLKVMLANILMLQDWAKAKPGVIVEAYLGNNVLWSLSYEWWFYMAFFPLITYIRSESVRDNVVFCASIAAAVVYLFYPLFVVRIVMYMAIWWSGVYYAQRYIAGEVGNIRLALKPVLTLSTILAILVLNAFLAKRGGEALFFGLHPVLELRHFLFALLAIVSAYAWRMASWFAFDKLVKPFAVVAPISYVLYICHWPLFTNATYLSFIGNAYLEWFAYFAVVLILSYLIEVKFYSRVRRPLMKAITGG